MTRLHHVTNPRKREQHVLSYVREESGHFPLFHCDNRLSAGTKRFGRAIFHLFCCKYFQETQPSFYEVIPETHDVFSALLLRGDKEKKEVSANYPHQATVQKFPISESRTVPFLVSVPSQRHRTYILLRIKQADESNGATASAALKQTVKAGCVATWETGVAVILTRCWNNKLSMRFCCSRSNTRVRSFTHSSFKSWKRGQTGRESDHG